MSQSAQKPLFVAEISANHLGSLARAHELIVAAKHSGANAVKFQTYTPDTMTLDDASFSISGDHELWGGRTLYGLYAEAMTPWEWHEELFAHCRELNLVPFSSPFDRSAVEFLEKLNPEIYKIASLETSDLELIRTVAETGKKIIISTGATEWYEIQEAVSTVRKTGNTNLVLLLCTSSYPSLPEDSHLRRLKLLQDEFECEVGLSDHTLGVGVSIAALALGAVVIEKHLTLNRKDGGADGAFSMEPDEFSLMVNEGLAAFQALGEAKWETLEQESESRKLRRSLFITEDVKKGDVISSKNLRSIRPNGGLSPRYYEELLGKKFASDHPRGTAMKLEYAE